MKFRIVEERSVRQHNGKTVSVPVFYVEMGRRQFLFWITWDRYLTGFDTFEQAQDLLNAVQEEYHFKSRVITR